MQRKLSTYLIPVNEVFQSIQGEGIFTGTPSVFIRTQGCPVGCPWCDTKHTWDINPAERVELASVQAKTVDGPSYAMVSAMSLDSLLDPFHARHVVFTGGEPFIHPAIGDLCQAALDRARTVQVETSGTQPIDCSPGVFVTVSPKYDMPGGRPVLDEALARADEIKIPVGKQRDIELALRVSRIAPGVPLWLQPISESKIATALCVEAAALHNFRVSIQMHKQAGLR